jgi:hypothetical protein
MKKAILFAACLAWLGGCSLGLSEHQKSESVKASEAISAQHDLTIRRALESGPEFGRYSVSNDVRSMPLRESLEITSHSGSNAGSKDSADGKSETSIPAGVKWLLAAAGALALFYVGKLIWTSAKTTAIGQGVSQGLKVADGLVGSYLQSWETHAQTTVDQKEQAEANAEIAELRKMKEKLKSI